VDISHEVPPQDIDRAAFVLKCAAPFFPQGTVHVVVVDPGVGTERLILAVRTRDHVYLAPNNGVLKYVFDGHPDAEVFCVTRSEYFRETVSRTFHGRDIFAPVAAHLAKGLAVEKLGRPFDAFERGMVRRPLRLEGRFAGEIVAFDGYGNGISNIPGAWLEGARVARVQTRGMTFKALSRSYLDVPAGEPLALIGSADVLELSVNRGSAKERLGLELGDEVTVFWE
jgi:S-adenosylmethionine hydrolase